MVCTGIWNDEDYDFLKKGKMYVIETDDDRKSCIIYQRKFTFFGFKYKFAAMSSKSNFIDIKPAQHIKIN